MKARILFFLLAIFVYVSFVSCNKDAEGVIYNENVNTVSFASTQMNIEVTADDKGVVKFPVYRGSKDGDLSVDLTMTSSSNLFSLKTPSVKFSKDESVVYAELSFGDVNNLGVTDEYQVKVSIANEDKLSISGVATLVVKLKRKLTWEVYGVGKYTSGLFGEAWDQTIEKAKEGNIYRLPDCIFKGYPFVFVLSEDGQSLASWSVQASGYKHNTYGMVYFSGKSMVRTGQTLAFTLQGLVVVNGKYAVLVKSFTETLELP
ncbi:hypothetical protein [Alistipes sp. ZOR0009]|uniref:hypothetical protein n=1 Tax=Alistipes sp. ZOR0009 TaxID=1339253 RepID=UPI0006480AA4|nr:hypothetical protein [Alistipes sp. ZOR0009]